MACWIVLVSHVFAVASAASWTRSNGGIPGPMLRPSQKNELVPSTVATSHAALLDVASSATTPARTPCFPDIPGGRWAAGATMFGCIALTGFVTVGLVSYVIHNRPAAIPAPVSSSGHGNDGNVPNDVSNSMAMVRPNSRRIYMHTLDGMRVLLVIAVIFAHYPIGLPDIAKHCLGWPMQFFFVLSGFVAQVQQEASSDKFDWFSGWVYVARRLARILPLYQLGLILQYCIMLMDKQHCQPVISWPLNALLLQAVFPVKVCGEPDLAWTLGYTHFNGNGPAWFAACIVWFSCLFPLLYNARPRSQSHGFWPTILLVGILICRAVPDLVAPRWGTYDAAAVGPHLYALSPIRLMEYVAGMWAAQLAGEISQRFSVRHYWCWFFDLSLVLLIAMVYISLKFLKTTWLCSGDYHITAFCCLVCITARLAAEMPDESKRGLSGAVLHRVIGCAALTYLAPYSFAAYIFQTSFMSWLDMGQDFYLHRFILLWLFAILVTTYIEEPIRVSVEARLKGKAREGHGISKGIGSS